MPRPHPGNRDVLRGSPNATMFPVEDVDALADLSRRIGCRVQG